MRPIVYWWRMNWDYLLIVALVLILALTLGGVIGAVGDTVRHLRIGY